MSLGGISPPELNSRCVIFFVFLITIDHCLTESLPTYLMIQSNVTDSIETPFSWRNMAAPTHLIHKHCAKQIDQYEKTFYFKLFFTTTRRHTRSPDLASFGPTFDQIRQHAMIRADDLVRYLWTDLSCLRNVAIY